MLVRVSQWRVIVWVTLLLNVSCIKDFVDNRSADFRKIRIQKISLFNQRTNPLQSNKPWRGDWLFRRERLLLLDRELTDIKPDLIIFQNMMRRSSNRFESDQGILSAGSLNGYRWHSSNIQEYSDTGEEESLGLAISSPLEFVEGSSAQSKLYGTHSLALETLTLERQRILVANLELSASLKESDFNKIIDDISQKMKSEQICSKRLILALSASPVHNENLLKLAQTFELQDSAKGFCNAESDCYTASSLNPIFDLTYGEKTPERMDFLFVHPTAKIYRSEPNMKEPGQSDLGYFKQFSLKSIWVSDRFGWSTDLTLARCEASKVL